MLLQVKYGYHVDAIPRRARTVRAMEFFDDAAIEIAEISASEAPPVMELREAARWTNDEGPSYRILGHQGRLYRPVLGYHRRPFEFAAWCEDLREGRRPHDGHVLGDPAEDCDPLGLLPLVAWEHPGEDAIYGVHSHLWPRHRIEEVPLREVVLDRRETCRIQVQRNAAKLLLIGGALHLAISEPVWVSNFLGNRLNIRGIDECLRTRVSLIHRGERPFADFELFRLDRAEAAVAAFGDTHHWYDKRRAARIGTFSYAPRAQDTAPLLRLTLDFARELLARERRLRTSKYPPENPSNYPDLMADFPFPAADAAPYHHVMALRSIEERLRDLSAVGEDDRNPVASFGLCLRGAVRRGIAEIEQGLIAVPDLAAEDDAALSGMAP